MSGELLSADQIPGVIYSHVETRRNLGEQFIVEHGACYILSGELVVVEAGRKSIYADGSMLFFRKNFLAKFTKRPASNQNFRSITVLFDNSILQDFSKQFDLTYQQPYFTKDAVLELGQNELLENFFNTLIPYFCASLPAYLIKLKRQEALMLLMQINPAQRKAGM